MIFYDPTEAYPSSRIKRIKNIGKPMKNLEAATGCDIALLRDDSGIKDDFLFGDCDYDEIGRLLKQGVPNNEIVGQTGATMLEVIKTQKFFVACYRGILVQRKSGSDMLGSIPKMASILERMEVWARVPWLLITGNVEPNKFGKVVINNRATDFDYGALIGSLDFWQIRGGYLTWLYDDESVFNWIGTRNELVQKEQPERIVVLRQPLQKLIGPDSEDAWISTLMTFPGIGAGMARKMQETFANLKTAICFMSDETSHQWDYKPDGYGPITSQKARKRLGMQTGERLVLVQDSDTDLERDE